MSIRRLTPLTALVALACGFAQPVWSNGDKFFQAQEIPGNPEFVIFGNVKDDRGKYLSNATVRIVVPEHQLEFEVQTDVIGRFRTPDIGRAINDFGWAVEPEKIQVEVDYPGYRVVRRQNRGKYAQNKGVVEINFQMKKEPA